MTKWEFITGVHRDSCASHIGHHSRLAYMAVADNESVAKTRFKMLEKMIQPCGPPPAKKGGEDDDQE